MKVATNLYVLVKRHGQTVVELQMPAMAIDNLEELIGAETAKKISAIGFDLRQIKENVQASGYIPQVVFGAKLTDKEISVWLA